MVEWFAGYAIVDDYVEDYENGDNDCDDDGDDDSDVWHDLLEHQHYHHDHDEDYGEKKKLLLDIDDQWLWPRIFRIWWWDADADKKSLSVLDWT